MNLNTTEFIRENKNWRELLTQAPYYLSIDEDDDYALLKYNQIESDFNEPICKECRGLIISTKAKTAAALSFYKFFNVQESFADRIYWKDCKVQEKVDGSKMLMWYDNINGKWRLSTSGTLDAYKAEVSGFNISFGDLFDKALNQMKINSDDFFKALDNKYCYTFELVSPESRVVVPYKKCKIYLIGLRRLDDFMEESPDIASDLIALGIPRPKEYPLHNLQECLSKAENMGYDEEGFVVVDKYWKRVKIKSPAYVAAHYLKGNGVNSKYKFMQIIERGEQDEFLSYFPEYKEYIDEVDERMADLFARIEFAIFELIDMESDEEVDRKKQAEFINSKYKDISGFLFKYLDIDLTKLFIASQWSQLSKDKKMSLLGYKYNKEDESTSAN